MTGHDATLKLALGGDAVKALLMDRDEADAQRLATRLAMYAPNVQTECAYMFVDALKRLRDGYFDVLLLDHDPATIGPSIAEIARRFPQLPIIVLFDREDGLPSFPPRLANVREYCGKDDIGSLRYAISIAAVALD